MDLKQFTTEERNPDTMDFHRMSFKEMAEAMNREDLKAVQAVSREIPKIAEVIGLCVNALKSGGRIIYIGAGTSGRLGILDAVEIPLTFGVPEDMITGIIAGGEEAFISGVEDAEDSAAFAEEALKKEGVTDKDIVIGIAASGRTPYTLGALEWAGKVGAKTVAIVNNKDSVMAAAADIAVEVITGPEAVTGSTRLKAGTSQKLILNMISTCAMAGIGKVHENFMVDVRQPNEKLKVRAEDMVMALTGCERETAKEKIGEAGGSVKVAVTALLLNISCDEAVKKLEDADGHIREAVK